MPTLRQEKKRRLEKQAEVGGAVADESDDGLMEDESILGVKKDGLPDYDEDAVTIEGDLNLDFQLLRQIPCPYTNVIAEFADVEIFAISVDSFLLELTAHHYHNWLLGGQTIVWPNRLTTF
uniref:Uncharacterized protein n=1 Tax=Ditylenchus dipsaci TaxID=166011 RepID=A0A915DQT5_9BILA